LVNRIVHEVDPLVDRTLLVRSFILVQASYFLIELVVVLSEPIQ